MSSKKNSAKGLGILLQDVFRQKNWHDRLGQHQVFLFWDKLVGELSARAQPDIIRGNVLWISVSDSVWMQQLQYEKQTLLEQINNELILQHKRVKGKKTKDAPQIEDIKFKLAPNLSHTPRNTPKQKTKQCTVPIDADRLEEFESTTSCIDNEDIKKSIKNLWLALERRKNRNNSA